MVEFEDRERRICSANFLDFIKNIQLIELEANAQRDRNHLCSGSDRRRAQPIRI